MNARRSGFTLVELMIALVLLGIVVTKLTIVIGEARSSFGRESARMAVEDRALYVLDQIAFAVMGSDRGTLNPDPALPAFSSLLRYQISMGVEDGEVVWSAPQRIALTNDTGRQVTWFEQPGLANERRVAWSNWVTQLFEGEVANGLDDNRNGLKDEKGLSFDLDGDSVIIRLTIEKPGVDGEPIVKTLQTRVTCRN